MKRYIGWILGSVELVVGFILFVFAQIEIYGNSRYTWERPYTEYEAQVIITRWIGIVLLIWGIATIILKLIQTVYVNNHTQDINPLTQNGGAIRCANCGLSLAANVKICPRCGQPPSSFYVNPMERDRFCPACGYKINAGQRFCQKCGRKVD